MENKVPFCTCTDTACPNHPTNHQDGCTRCIEKNLANGEIPSCFFKLVNPSYHGPGYYYKDFAEVVKGEK
ncbi:MAG: DUF6485 family protein [Clostridia bacterium]|nr:DUF6485 family protein [Clostridia bacterium]